MLGFHANVAETVRLLQMPRMNTTGEFVKETFVDPVSVPIVCQFEDDGLVLNCNVIRLVMLAVTVWVMTSGGGRMAALTVACIKIRNAVLPSRPTPVILKNIL